MPGSPGVLLGQNDHIAWGFTTADTDTQDLFVETIDPADPAQYLTPDGPKPFETREETIHVKGGADVVLTSARRGTARCCPTSATTSRASPVRARRSRSPSPASATATRRARRSCASTARRTGTSSWPRCALFQTPTQNIVYADTAGDIGFFSPGLVPVRKSGDGLAPTDGASGATDWVGTVPFEQLPQLHNPRAGFLFNANNANVADDHQPTFGQDWEETFRARRIQEFFDTIDKHSLDTSAAMQADRLSLAALALKPFVARSRPPASGRARRRRCSRPGTA